ncbi:MAG TPA: NUDIX hydrolase [Lachnospiraceae bacterium]|nr:NUDIX hydrolase [Lachnospiraceae bacterium]
MDYKLKRLNRELAVEGKALSFYRDTMQLPDGKIEKWDFVHHKRGGGACVVPVLPDGRILMIHQYRPAVNRETTELPAGAFDAEDPDFAITASRELEEETGYRCGRIRRLVRLDTAVAWCNERVEVYLAQDLEKVSRQSLDEAEEISMEAFTAEELKRRIFAGEIRDAKTVAGIMAYLVDSAQI